MHISLKDMGLVFELLHWMMINIGYALANDD